MAIKKSKYKNKVVEANMRRVAADDWRGTAIRQGRQHISSLPIR
jgi:hypothetical protein